MKKVLLVLAVASMAVGFASCKKCYDCTTSLDDKSLGIRPVVTEVCDITANEAKDLEQAGTSNGVTTKCKAK